MIVVRWMVCLLVQLTAKRNDEIKWVDIRERMNVCESL